MVEPTYLRLSGMARSGFADLVGRVVLVSRDSNCFWLWDGTDCTTPLRGFVWNVNMEPYSVDFGCLVRPFPTLRVFQIFGNVRNRCNPGFVHHIRLSHARAGDNYTRSAGPAGYGGSTTCAWFGTATMFESNIIVSFQAIGCMCGMLALMEAQILPTPPLQCGSLLAASAKFSIPVILTSWRSRRKFLRNASTSHSALAVHSRLVWLLT